MYKSYLELKDNEAKYTKYIKCLVKHGITNLPGFDVLDWRAINMFFLYLKQTLYL